MSSLTRKHFCGLFLALLVLTAQGRARGDYNSIIISTKAHPAAYSAAQILAKSLELPLTNIIQQVDNLNRPKSKEIVLSDTITNNELPERLRFEVSKIRYDGYIIAFDNGGAFIVGKRPRSLLYAAGDYNLWKDKRSGKYIREPFFAIRIVGGSTGKNALSISEQVAKMGANVIARGEMSGNNLITLENSFSEIYTELPQDFRERIKKKKAINKENLEQFAKFCQNADVPYYTLFYGNDPYRWSPELTKVIYKVYPTLKGVRAPFSWEKATFCPSEALTWDIINACLAEIVELNCPDGEGLIVTFWDWYGIYCQCEKCRKMSLHTFPNQLHKCVEEYYKTLHKMGKKLIVRTWSSGCPHWFTFSEEPDGAKGRQWVNAPGHGSFGGAKRDLWGRVIDELPAEITLQTKVYLSDCEPDSRFNTLIGQVEPHSQIVEYQMTGQTRGRYYFPASLVDHTKWSLNKAYHLIGLKGGTLLSAGGTKQSNYCLANDILNSINIYVWKELSWNVDAKVDKIWRNWAISIYGEKAAPHIIKALKLSERAVNLSFSALGFGSDTTSLLPGDIYRMEVLLAYTNRYYLPEFAKYLEPSKKNIELVVRESKECIRLIDEMFKELELAKPFLETTQYKELYTRFDWMKEHAIVRRTLYEAYWRFRYLRHLYTKRTTDPDQMQHIVMAYDIVQEHGPNLFRYEPDLKFSCYDTTLANLDTKPSLGSPYPLMRELYERCKYYVEDAVGPNYLSENCKR